MHATEGPRSRPVWLVRASLPSPKGCATLGEVPVCGADVSAMIRLFFAGL